MKKKTTGKRVVRVKKYAILFEGKLLGLCDDKAKPFAGVNGRDYLHLPRKREIVRCVVEYTLPKTKGAGSRKV